MIELVILTIQTDKKKYIELEFGKKISNRIKINVFDNNSSSFEDEFNKKKSFLRYGKYLRKGEISCALGHQRIASLLLEKECTTAVVLEDDALLELNFEECTLTLSDYINKLAAPTVVILGHSKTIKNNLWFENLKYKLYDKIKIKKFVLGKKKQNYFGTVGYLCNREFIKLRSLDEVHTIADDWIFYEQEFGVQIYHLENPIVWEDLQTTSSTGNSLIIHHNILSKNFLRELFSAIKNKI